MGALTEIFKKEEKEERDGAWGCERKLKYFDGEIVPQKPIWFLYTSFISVLMISLALLH